MASSTGEIHKKLKVAIARRLKELDVYVDDELPDYVLVMVANKKDKKSMKNDLNLFLGGNTDKFVDWLFDVIEKLQSARGSSPMQEEAKKEKSKEKEKKEKKSELDKKERSRKDSDHHGHKSGKEKDSSHHSSKEKEREKEREREREREKEREKEEERERIHKEKERERERRIEKDREEREKKDRERKQREREEAERRGRKAVEEEKERRRRDEERARARERDRRERSLTWSDDENEIRLRRTQKVSSSIVSTVQDLPVPSMSSKVVVKRRMRPVADEKSSKGVKSLLQRAVNEANMSAAAGYGAPQMKKMTEKIEREEEEAESVHEYDNPMESEVPSTRQRQHSGHDEERVKEPQFIITMKRDQQPRQALKRKQDRVTRRDPSPLVVEEKKHRPRITGPSGKDYKEEEDEMDMDNESEDDVPMGDIIPSRKSRKDQSKSPVRKHSPIVWDGHIKLDDNDSSDDDDEAEIDKVLASTNLAHSSSSGVHDGEVLPPTHLLSRGNSYTYSPMAQSPVQAPVYIPTPINPVPPFDSLPQLSYIPAPPVTSQPLGSTKINEKCRFWPNCAKDEQSCPYVHPIKPCMAFPSCGFGNRCMYIHPPCKYNTKCYNNSCHFTHSANGVFPSSVLSMAAPRPPIATVAPMPKYTVPSNPLPTPSAPGQAKIGDGVGKGPDVSMASDPSASFPPLLPSTLSSIPCRFGAQCTNQVCKYKHPATCRYGAGCFNPSCYFYHPPQPKPPTVPSTAAVSGKFKWQSTNA